MLSEKFTDYLNQSIKKNWNRNALANYNGESFTYEEVAGYILAIHKLYKGCGIAKGDKVALISRNSARWCIVYLATVTYGAVIVPVLPDFKTEDMQELINHSDASVLFCSDHIFEKFTVEKLKAIKLILSTDSFKLIQSIDKKLESIVAHLQIDTPSKIEQEDYNLSPVNNSELAVISYTSGTTGHSKGVMLSHNSLAANIQFAQQNMPLKSGDPIVSFLPLAHTYGCAFEFLFPFTLGCEITILTKTPSPQIVVQAFKEIKPALILSVPLVIEKIYKKQLLPVINKPIVKTLIAIPVVNKILLSNICKKLVETFGGNFTEIVIGGAAFNPGAETFFRKIKFPFTVGYGMTECGPLISYASSKIARLGSSGKLVHTLEIKIDSEDPENKVGEIMVRGDNVMSGYYKNEEATNEIIDGEGWLHTGDLGIIDKDGFIYLKGRSKSLILGSSGKNIYPEEIESALNNCPGVLESLVVDRHEKLIALIYPDSDIQASKGNGEKELEQLMHTNIDEVNKLFPKYMQVAGFELVKEEFEKTPKRSIRRFLYK